MYVIQRTFLVWTDSRMLNIAGVMREGDARGAGRSRTYHITVVFFSTFTRKTLDQADNTRSNSSDFRLKKEYC